MNWINTHCLNRILTAFLRLLDLQFVYSSLSSTLANLHEMTSLAATHTHFSITGHCLGACNLPQYLHGHHWAVGPVGCLVLSSFVFLAILTLSNCHDSVMVFSTVVWALCASTLLAQANTPSLVISSLLLVAVNSFIISSSMHLSLSPLIS